MKGVAAFALQLCCCSNVTTHSIEEGCMFKVQVKVARDVISDIQLKAGMSIAQAFDIYYCDPSRHKYAQYIV